MVESDDHDLQDENLDAFLGFLESRLRADFTSPDLSRTISCQGSRGSVGNSSTSATTSALPSRNASSPSKFLRLIIKVFHRAAKPVKLRALLSVLGLESDQLVESGAANASGSMNGSYGSQQRQGESVVYLDEQRTDEIVWKLLEKAEQDDEMWVRVVAGILRGMMFKTSGRDPSTLDDVNYFSGPACRGKTAERQLSKITEGILTSVKEAFEAGEKEMERAKAQLLDSDVGENDINGSSDDTKQQHSQMDSLLIGRDACPTFVPFRFSLLSPDTTKTIMPEVDTNSHFAANMNASIFKVDAEVEEKRAEEEGKELQLQKQRTMNDNVAGRGVGPGGRTKGADVPSAGRPTGAVMAGRMRGRFSNTAGRGGDGDRGSSLFLSGRVSGRGEAGAMGGRALGSAGRVGGRLGTAGRSGSLSRLGGAGKTGGRAVSAVSHAPLQRRVPGAARATLSASGRGGGGAGGEASKMKMIDVKEVEGLNRAKQEREKQALEDSVQSRKAERRRKLLEDAAASGLRNKEKIARVGGTDTSNDGPKAESNGGVDPFPLPESSKLFDTASGRQQQSQQAQQPQQSWESLLEKSNKLSDEDRARVNKFFQRRASSNTPPLASGGDGSNVWKVKLNEEKTVDPQSGEVVKETLYLELDFQSLGYKKTRKIKRK